MEGGTVYGLTAALKGEITIQKGRVVQRHFNDYQMIRHNEAPEVETHIVASAETPGGIGEPSTAVAAGALVNAIAAATGKRIYRLPIRAEQLRSRGSLFPWPFSWTGEQSRDSRATSEGSRAARGRAAPSSR
jgi:isoquinoline 1-oxidoreductase beta subunit